jgi:hypothetical protein
VFLKCAERIWFAVCIFLSSLCGVEQAERFLTGKSISLGLGLTNFERKGSAHRITL